MKVVIIGGVAGGASAVLPERIAADAVFFCQFCFRYFLTGRKVKGKDVLFQCVVDGVHNGNGFESDITHTAHSQNNETRHRTPAASGGAGVPPGSGTSIIHLHGKVTQQNSKIFTGKIVQQSYLTTIWKLL